MSLSFELSLDRCFDSDLESDLGFWLGKLNVRDWSEAYIKSWFRVLTWLLWRAY